MKKLLYKKCYYSSRTIASKQFLSVNVFTVLE